MRGLPRCVVGLAARGGAQDWARQLTALGHAVRMMSPALVRPYRKGNQPERQDADAILEAVTRPRLWCVMVKRVVQQDLRALQRRRLSAADRRRGRMRVAHYPASGGSCCAR
jgi:transposase